MLRRLTFAAVAAALALPAGAAAREPCEPGFGCRTVTVPLDRSGAVAGKVRLAVKRLLPVPRGADTGVMLFPGGPGAATNAEALLLARELRPALRTRQLILFDQRGTGDSGYIDCDIREAMRMTANLIRSYEKSVERCANKLGPRRAFYTSADTADDIEAVRRALGLRKLALVGVSYGTRTALEYAARYPDRVDRLVLDSVVAPEGPSPYGLEAIAAVPRVLRALCRGGGCRGITDDPAADLAVLVDRIRERGAVRPRRALDFFGCHVRPALTRTALFNALLAGDFDTAGRSTIPAVVAAARDGDASLYAYVSLFERGEELFRCLFEAFDLPLGARQAGDTSFSLAVNVATYCEEGPMPWPRGTPPAERRRVAEQGLAHLPDSAFEPFDRATALAYAAGNGCRFWPDSGRTVSPPGPLPDVPVLAMAGEEDLRTPLEDAARVAGRFRRAKVLAIPDYGHSTLGTPCAQRALRRFFAGEAVGDCHRPARALPRPVTITELRCAVKAFDSAADVLAGRIPTRDRVCERALARYLQDLQRDLAERRS